MTFYFYDEPIDKEPICPNCGAVMQQEREVMGVMIFRCHFCGEWKEGR